MLVINNRQCINSFRENLIKPSPAGIPTVQVTDYEKAIQELMLLYLEWGR